MVLINQSVISTMHKDLHEFDIDFAATVFPGADFFSVECLLSYNVDQRILVIGGRNTSSLTYEQSTNNNGVLTGQAHDSVIRDLRVCSNNILFSFLFSGTG